MYSGTFIVASLWSTYFPPWSSQSKILWINSLWGSAHSRGLPTEQFSIQTWQNLSDQDDACDAVQIGSLSNDVGDLDENGKKAKVSIGKTTALHVHHAFLYISLPSQHDYVVKIPNFTFCGGREHKTRTFFFFSWTLIQPSRIQLQRKLPTFDELNEME